MRNALSDLHDAVLRGIRVDWSVGSCRLEFEGAPTIGAPFSLLFLGMQRLELPRLQPWGTSASVLDAVVTGDEVRIEMQSGDTIVIEAESGFEWHEDKPR